MMPTRADLAAEATVGPVTRGEMVGKKNRRQRGFDEDFMPQRKYRKDDWKELMRGQSGQLKGEEPDFSEEGWARRRPKKK